MARGRDNTTVQYKVVVTDSQKIFPDATLEEYIPKHANVRIEPLRVKLPGLGEYGIAATFVSTGIR